MAIWNVVNFIVVLLICLQLLGSDVLCDHEKQSKFVNDSKETIDFLLRKGSRAHPHHYHKTPQEQYQCRQMENERKEDGVMDFHDDVCTNAKKEIIKRSMRDVSCGKPRSILVKLKPSAPNFVLLPDVAKIKRCSGFCHHTPHSCLPTKVSIVKIPVYKVDMTSATKSPICMEYRLEQHEECDCSCSLIEKHCTSQQFYAKETCECVCMNDEEKQNCLEEMERDSSKFWDKASCSCQCLPMDCPPNLLWVPGLCRCANVMESGGVTNDELINTLY